MPVMSKPAVLQVFVSKTVLLKAMGVGKKGRVRENPKVDDTTGTHVRATPCHAIN